MWADILMDELARCGVRHAVLSPGSRSAPLALAARRRFGAKCIVVVDERSAAYVALGVSKMGGAWPVLLISTSGTAAANYHAALVEADQTGAPLVVVTADRPHELRDVGANQAIQQTGLYGRTVRWSCDLMLPERTPEGLRHLRRSACQAVGMARLRQGPVHMNVPLREPLAPTADQFADLAVPEELLAGRTDAKGQPVPWTRVTTPERVADPWTLERWAHILAARRGVVLVGPAAAGSSMAKDAEILGDTLGVPLLVDPLAGSHPVSTRPAGAVGLPDLVLSSPKSRKALRPAWILQVGGSPTSKHLRAYIEDADVPRLVVDALGKGWDEQGTSAEMVHADAHRLLGELASAARKARGSPSDASWLSRFYALASTCLRARPQETDWEGPLPQILLDELADRPLVGHADPALLWVGSSLPIRDIDRYGAFAEPHGAIRILSNRGASGIDGVISSAAGAASVTKGRCIAYVGDLTFLHDLNGLAAVAKYAPHLTIVVLNNGGGRIFEHLPIADSIPREEFEELFATPQKVDIGKAAAAFGIEHVRLDGTAKLAATLKGTVGGVVQVVVDPKFAVRRRKEHLARVVAAVDKLVDQWEKVDTAATPRRQSAENSEDAEPRPSSAFSASSAVSPVPKRGRKRQAKAKVRK
ncbi:MAG: 2-succinyl-5-enolpyruvyl-6-hydroxy-3-cyclohexene-1-carboxylic-acid synthase [Thermoplasmatota archaeon]